MARFSFLCLAILLTTGGGGCGSSSGPYGSPRIVTQPADQTVATGSPATFVVVASGLKPLTYQWQRNDTAISGETGASTTTPPTSSADNGATYRVVVSNAEGSVTSNEAALTVNSGNGMPQTLNVHTSDLTGTGDAPLIAFQDGDGPWQNVPHNAGGQYTFTVTADRYGIAVADATTKSTSAMGFIFQGTVSEVPDLTLPLASVIPRFGAQATLTNIPDGGFGSIFGLGSGPAPGPTVITGQLPAGIFDVLALDEDESVSLHLLRYGLSVLVENTNAVTDLGGYDIGGGFMMESHTLTFQGLSPNQAHLTAVSGLELRTGKDSQRYSSNLVGGFPMMLTADANGNLTAPLKLIPPLNGGPNDVQFVWFRGGGKPPTAPHLGSAVSMISFFNATGDQTMTLPNDFTLTDYTLSSTTPYARAGVAWEPIGSLPLYLISMSGFDDTGRTVGWYSHVTNGWLRNASQASYVLPDLSGITGWSHHLQFASGSDLYVKISAASSVDLATALAANPYTPYLTLPFQPVAGQTILFIDKPAGDITVP